jgi:hypothetical protein
MVHRTPGARDRRLSQREPGYAASGERHEDLVEIRSWTRRIHHQPVGEKIGPNHRETSGASSPNQLGYRLCVLGGVSCRVS